MNKPEIDSLVVLYWTSPHLSGDLLFTPGHVVMWSEPQVVLYWTSPHLSRVLPFTPGHVVMWSEPQGAVYLCPSIWITSWNFDQWNRIWRGPRLLLAALHIHDLVKRSPAKEECQLLYGSCQTFRVESEISSQILSECSHKVQLLHYSEQNDIKIFRL